MKDVDVTSYKISYKNTNILLNNLAGVLRILSESPRVLHSEAKSAKLEPEVEY